MPLKTGSSQKIISTNIQELMTKPSKTLSKRLGVAPKEAQRRQAVAIALSSAGLPKNKTKK